MKLEHDLHDLGSAYEIPSGDLTSVRRRARHRQATRRRATGAAAALALVAGTSGVLRLAADDGGITPVASEGSATRGDSGITWTVAEAGADESLAILAGGGEAIGGRLYALSTAPGTRDVDGPHPKLAWTSADGVAWTPAGVVDDLYLTDLAGRDGRVYAVGTGPASAVTTDGQAVPSLVVGWSEDGAASFTTAEVPVDLGPIAAASRRVVVNQQQIATSGDHVVAVVGVNADLDVPPLLPEGETAPHGWAVTGAGIEVLGEVRDGCEAHTDGGRPTRVWSASCGDGAESMTPQEAHEPGRSYTWSELGIDGDLRQAALGHPFVFASTAGGSFERVEVPTPGGMLQSFTLDAGDGGFDLMIASGGADDLPAANVLQSADGRTWTPAGDLPGGLQWAAAIGQVGGRTVIAGQGRDRSLVVVGDGAGGWREVDLAGLLDEPLDDGEQLALSVADVGPAGVAVTGFVFDERRDGRVHHLLFASRDGETWSVDDVDELAGTAVGAIGRVIVGDDRIVVTGNRQGERRADGHARQVTLVGSLS